MSKSKHHVTNHYVVDGVPTVVEHYFDSYEEAFAHAESSQANIVELFAPGGTLLSSRQKDQATEAVTSNTEE